MTQPDPNAQSGVDGAQSGAAGGETGTGATGAQSGTDQQQGQAPATGAQSGADDSKVHTAAELEAQRARTRAADQRAATLEQELKQLRDKDLPEMDKLKRDVEEFKAKAEKAEADLRTERIRNAFLKDNSYEWQDPSVALGMVDISKLDIDDKGEVSGLKLVLDGLAKQYPWMLKPKTGDGADGGGAAGQTGVPPMNQGKPAGTGKPSKEALAQRFPALRSRLGG